MASPELSQFRRIVVKVGSALLVDSDKGEVRASWLAALADDMAKLHREGRDVLVVSSGSIALGRSRLKLPRGPLKLEESQGAAAVGQVGHGDADHPHARGLHLGRDDAHLGADEAVHQGRFAGIGRADDGNKAATLFSHGDQRYRPGPLPATPSPYGRNIMVRSRNGQARARIFCR